ncbi:CPBP family intramembrane glutamic endopeptidase [Deinococcus pimensis]|uniref:CPBP family intramembrane glutamic endopeptidase n=1 Tax=Deinococcus pimensis TaxID=309888 RepID=UPI000481C4B3|nr:CPBP family intramembrane glutamic endopeptidase [Deinococcus pimensis]
MEFPYQLVLLSIPSIWSLAVLRARGLTLHDAAERIGLAGTNLNALLLATLVAAVGAALVAVALIRVDPAVWHRPNVSLSRYAGMQLNTWGILIILVREALYVTLGEELLFRGVLGSWFTTRLGFLAGNTLQAACWVVPHLLLLTLSLKFLPVLVCQFALNWAFGWLRHHTGSVLPGWWAHSVINTVTAVVSILTLS